MELPRHLHQSNGRFCIVETQEDADLLLANGWALLPEKHVEQPIPVTIYDAKLAIEASASAAEPDAAPLQDMNAEAAKEVIDVASADELDALEAAENAGKSRKGVLQAIENRRIELAEGAA